MSFIAPGQEALSPVEQEALTLLATDATYDDIRHATGFSRGKIYSLAVRFGARKNEQRIRERATARRQRQIEFLREVIDTTATSDVLDFLDGIPDATAQLVLTSPPYRVGKAYGGAAGADTLRFLHYHGFLMQVLSECARVLREGGTLFLQLGQCRDWEERLMPLDVLLFEDLRRAGLTYQSRIVWTIPHGLTPRRRLSERYETVLVFSKGDNPVFNANAARVPQLQPAKRAYKGSRRGQLSGHPLGAWPSNVWDDIGNVGHNHPEKVGHPAQFPLALARRAILLFSQSGDVVLDPFNGSGTTQAAAIQCGRHFIGADLFYEDVRAKRLAKIVPDLYTPLPGVTDESIAVWQAEAQRVDVQAQAITPAEDEQMLLDLFATVA